MSTYENDIRRIARRDKQKKRHPNKIQRDAIYGETTPIIDAASSPPTTGNKKVAASKCETDEQKDQPFDEDDPNTFSQGDNGSGSNTPTGEEFLDGDRPTYNDTPSGGDYPTGGYGGLSGISSLYDCNTDEKIDVSFNGKFPNQEGWDDPEQPPIDESYEINKFWYTNVGILTTEGYGRSEQDSLIVTTQLIKENNPQTDPSVIVWGKNTCSLPQRPYSLHVGGTPQVPQGGELCGAVIDGVFWNGGAIYFAEQFTCPITFNTALVNVCAFGGVPIIPPTSDDCWVDDNNTSVAFINGKFRTSDYDCDAKVREDSSDITLCATPGGVEQIQMQSGVNGNIITTYANNVMIVTDKDGKLVFAGDATQTNKEPYLPTPILQN